MQTADLLTTAEVADRLGIDRSGVTRRVQDGRLTPAMKLGGIRGAYLFDAEQIAALAEGTTTDEEVGS